MGQCDGCSFSKGGGVTSPIDQHAVWLLCLQVSNSPVMVHLCWCSGMSRMWTHPPWKQWQLGDFNELTRFQWI
ncbi:hypothetical protein LDENG_00241380 [Lucifuga dentata]|nr:hypothetical protein LDENG_00241380 [Lucifuga dentata]